MSKRRAKPAADRSSRYDELLKAAADRHHTMPTDSRAIYEAGVRLLHESMTAQMVAGEAIDVASYMKVSEQLQALLPTPAPVEVRIKYVNPSLTACPQCDVEFKPPEVDDAVCPSCGLVFSPESPVTTREKKRAAEQPKLPLPPPTSAAPNGAGFPPPDTTPAPASETQASAPVPARPAPVPVNPPPKPVRNLATAEWERQRGYGRSARDGGMIRGAPVPHFDPNLSSVNYAYENYDNDKPSCWTGYQGRPNSAATPDINPSYNSDGSPRVPHKPPY